MKNVAVVALIFCILFNFLNTIFLKSATKSYQYMET